MPYLFSRFSPTRMVNNYPNKNSPVWCSWTTPVPMWCLIYTNMSVHRNSNQLESINLSRCISSISLWPIFLNIYTFCWVPVSTTLLDDKRNPKCGVARVMKVYILSLYLSRWGRAARMINPPKECPTNESFENFSLGLQSLIHEITSSANLWPIKNMSYSVLSSLHVVESRIWSGYLRVIKFFHNLMSKELPW